MQIFWFLFLVAAAYDDQSLMQQNMEIGQKVSAQEFTLSLNQIGEAMSEMPFPGKMRQMALDSLMTEIAAEGKMSPTAKGLLQQVIDLLQSLIDQFKAEKAVNQAELDSTNATIDACNSAGVSHDGVHSGEWSTAHTTHKHCRNLDQDCWFDYTCPTGMVRNVVGGRGCNDGVTGCDLSYCDPTTSSSEPPCSTGPPGINVHDELGAFQDSATKCFTLSQQLEKINSKKPDDDCKPWDTQPAGAFPGSSHTATEIVAKIKAELIDNIDGWNADVQATVDWLQASQNVLSDCGNPLDATQVTIYYDAGTADCDTRWAGHADGLEGICDAATTRLESMVSGCDAHQRTAESKYCQWRAVRNSMCETRTECVDGPVNGATVKHGQLVAAIKPVADRRTEEGHLVVYIKCLVGLLKDEDTDHTKCAGTPTNAESQEWFNVTYPTLKTMDACDVAVVNDLPTDAAFKTSWYSVSAGFHSDAPAFDDSVQDCGNHTW